MPPLVVREESYTQMGTSCIENATLYVKGMCSNSQSATVSAMFQLYQSQIYTNLTNKPYTRLKILPKFDKQKIKQQQK
jgi:hypothetical protein